jgi:hypothetical protein
MIQRQHAGPKGHDGDGECGPRQVKIRPALRYDELNNASHDQEAEGAEPCRQARDQKDGQHDLGDGVGMSQQCGGWNVVDAAENVQGTSNNSVFVA